MIYVLLMENYRLFYDIMVIMATTDSLHEHIQALIGAFIYGIGAPFINLITQIYTLYKLDDFRWGKTRIAVAEKKH